MNGVEEALFGRIGTADPASENEYTGKDGLRYCRKCHEPTQCRIVFMGRERIVPCLCTCGKEEVEREKQETAERDRLYEIARMKAAGIQDRHLREWTFAKAEDTPVIRMAQNYVKNWKRVKAENLGLLFWGDVGTGKSYAAACIANALLEMRIPVLMTNFSKMLNQMGGLYSEERFSYISSLSGFSLLIIDDLGIERSTDYAKEQVYSIIDERYKSGLPVVVTTNLTIEDLRCPMQLADARIYSRILEMCTPVHVAGSDRRTAAGKSKQEILKEVLFS